MDERIPGYVTYAEARARLGIRDRIRLFLRLQEAGIPTFRHPKDRRYRLIRDEDMQRLLTPREVTAGETVAS